MVPPPPGVQPIAYDDGSVIVRFKDVAGLAPLRASALARVKGTFLDKNRDGVYDRFANVDRGGHLMKVDLDRSVSVEQALELLRADPAVAYAEPNYLWHVAAIPADPFFGELYGLHNTGQLGGTADADIDGPEAWDTSTGSSDIVVGVIDTGVDYNHADLAANIWTNPGEIAGNGLDDDGNGVVDDIHGFNAINGSGDPMDDNSHGTHCSGTIGAVGDNGVGVAGVSWEVSIMAIKFLSGSGSGTTEGAIASVDYAIGQKNAGVNLRVLSNSWGGGGFSQGLKDAIDAAGAVDILFTAAAGNNFGSNNDTSPFYPATYDSANIVSVAATNRNDLRAPFSNIGPTTVDLGAPGEAVLSTVPGDDYAAFSGTSMATPHVSGAAALALALNPSLSTAELKELLLSTGDPRPALSGVTLSGRRLNVANLLGEIGPPVPHFNMAAAPGQRVLNQGESTSYAIDLTAVAGFTGDVNLSVTSQPALAGTLGVTPGVVGVPGAATLSVATTLATAPGTYALTITGQSGALTKSRTVSLRVRPFGTVEVDVPSTDTPLVIPGNDTADFDSILHVSQAIDIQSISVDLNVTHTWIGDLRITLTSPSGTEVVLHDHTGGSSDDIHQTYTFPTEFAGEPSEGDWVLNVVDFIPIDGGTLDDWTLRILGTPSVPSFGLTAPGSMSVTQDGTATATVGITSINGFGDEVSLSVIAPPSLDADFAFTPATVAAPGASALTVTASCGTAPGVYPVTLVGTSGSTVKTAQLSLTVVAFGTQHITYASTDTPRPIPDGSSTGLTSTVSVAESFPIDTLTVQVDITHVFMGDVTVQLIGPNNQSVLLHNFGGGTNLHQTYTVTAFDGMGVAGAWSLKVTDFFGGFPGTLDNWTLRASGAAPPAPPSASFSFTTELLTAAFTDTSTDAGCGGGDLTSWAWSFGDGATSTGQHPSHTYAAAGTYSVSLTVTNGNGLSSTATQSVQVRVPPQLAIERILRNRTTFEFTVDLTWSNALGTLVELYRNGLMVDIPNNDGVHRDVFRRYETSFTWKICEQFGGVCSNEVSVVFGSGVASANAEPTEATIVTRLPDGTSTSRVVPIEDER